MFLCSAIVFTAFTASTAVLAWVIVDSFTAAVAALSRYNLEDDAALVETAFRAETAIDADVEDEENEGPPSAIKSVCMLDRGDFLSFPKTDEDPETDSPRKRAALVTELGEARIFHVLT